MTTKAIVPHRISAVSGSHLFGASNF